MGVTPLAPEVGATIPPGEDRASHPQVGKSLLIIWISLSLNLNFLPKPRGYGLCTP